MTCCFIGHRKIDDTPELRERLQNILLDLIENGTVNFIFGDHSAFDDLCYDLVTELKEKFRRKYVMFKFWGDGYRR